MFFSVSSLFESFQTLFWASFGLIDLENFELTGIQSYTRFWGLVGLLKAAIDHRVIEPIKN